VADFFSDLAQRHEGHSVLVVTHFGVILQFISLFLPAVPLAEAIRRAAARKPLYVLRQGGQYVLASLSEMLSGERDRPRKEQIPVVQPEESGFQHLFVDVTYRCNMRCANCYVPMLEPGADPEAAHLLAIFRRLPRRTHLRLLGGEPTLRHDLPELIHGIRRLGHVPVLLTNGLRLADRGYVRELKSAGLRSVHLSCNGGLDDDLYQAIDNLRCAERKLAALDNLCGEHLRVSVGMILLRGLNDQHIGHFFRHVVRHRQVRELKLRSVGKFGRHSDVDELTLAEMEQLCADQLGVNVEAIRAGRTSETLCSFAVASRRVQLTQWPDLGNRQRGYLLPDGTLVPFFEWLVANGQTA
jgi:molybdenum cofactor biosynthesis enzyme MoaA